MQVSNFVLKIPWKSSTISWKVFNISKLEVRNFRGLRIEDWVLRIKFQGTINLPLTRAVRIEIKAFIVKLTWYQFCLQKLSGSFNTMTMQQQNWVFYGFSWWNGIMTIFYNFSIHRMRLQASFGWRPSDSYRRNKDFGVWKQYYLLKQ